MAEFEELYHDSGREDFSRPAALPAHGRGGGGMVGELERMNPGQAAGLRDYLKKYDFYARLLLEPPEQFPHPPFAVGHDEPVEARLIGNKSHNLLRLQQAGRPGCRPASPSPPPPSACWLTTTVCGRP